MSVLTHISVGTRDLVARTFYDEVLKNIGLKRLEDLG